MGDKRTGKKKKMIRPEVTETTVLGTQAPIIPPKKTNKSTKK